ncbi:MAG: NAD(P)H-hydrate epimerase, partial [Lachnospiraceae bacterium]|nr:NAD(P)H-hydrate epimerase [Lachnospiraceae bacterium]
MNYIASGDEMSRIDEYAINVIGIPQMVLMERAALAVYDYIHGKFSRDAKVLVVVEGGNNGGDGLALARILHSNGYDVEIYWGEILGKTSEAFKAQLDIVRKLNVKFADDILNCGYDVVVDAVFGAGLNRAITGKLADVINAMNDVDAFKLAVDIPSGIDATNGYVLGTAFRADATVTF